MLCQKCNHNNATVHYEQNINGKVTKLDLCPDCAKELSIAVPQLQTGFGSFFDSFGFGSLLGNMGSLSGFFDAPSQALSSLTCKSCGADLGSINSIGFLGCPDCYNAFESLVENNLNRCQKGSRHMGKRPNRLGGRLKKKEENTPSPKSEKAKLQAELKKAIKEENYEKAAELRDKIKELE